MAGDRLVSARGRRRCTLERWSPDRSDTGRLASPAGTAQAAPKPSFAGHSRSGRLRWEIVGGHTEVVARGFMDREGAQRAMAVLDEQEDRALRSSGRGNRDATRRTGTHGATAAARR